MWLVKVLACCEFASLAAASDAGNKPESVLSCGHQSWSHQSQRMSGCAIAHPRRWSLGLFNPQRGTKQAMWSRTSLFAIILRRGLSAGTIGLALSRCFRAAMKVSVLRVLTGVSLVAKNTLRTSSISSIGISRQHTSVWCLI